MNDVARHAGVSLSTVSYVLNETGRVGESRRLRVLDAVAALNYTPNAAARSLKRQTASTIGLVIPDLVNQFFALVAEGAGLAAAERDVLVVLCIPEATGRPTEYYTQLLKSQRLDGVLYLPGSAGMSPGVVLRLAEAGPVVLVDERIPGFDLPAVVADSRRGARDIANYVLDEGHRHIAIIGGPEALWTSEQRLSGYREAIASHGLSVDEVPVLVGDHHQQSGLNLASKLLSAAEDTRPTAILCANDLMAFGALEYCRQVGLRVPDDISIVGFDDVPAAAMLAPGLTTVRQPAHRMGYQAAELLFELIGASQRAEVRTPLPTTLEIRQSVGPPAKGLRGS
jgi:LacI family transcriptional regulator